jgi:hypothetical protein
VVIVGAAIIYGRTLVKEGREKKALHRRRVEDAEREELAREAWSNDWKRRYSKLVETASNPTDPAQGQK